MDYITSARNSEDVPYNIGRQKHRTDFKIGMSPARSSAGSGGAGNGGGGGRGSNFKDKLLYENRNRQFDWGGRQTKEGHPAVSSGGGSGRSGSRNRGRSVSAGRARNYQEQQQILESHRNGMQTSPASGGGGHSNKASLFRSQSAGRQRVVHQNEQLSFGRQPSPANRHRNNGSEKSDRSRGSDRHSSSRKSITTTPTLRNPLGLSFGGRNLTTKSKNSGGRESTTPTRRPITPSRSGRKMSVAAQSVMEKHRHESDSVATPEYQCSYNLKKMQQQHQMNKRNQAPAHTLRAPTIDLTSRHLGSSSQKQQYPIESLTQRRNGGDEHHVAKKPFGGQSQSNTSEFIKAASTGNGRGGTTPKSPKLFAHAINPQATTDEELDASIQEQQQQQEQDGLRDILSDLSVGTAEQMKQRKIQIDLQKQQEEEHSGANMGPHQLRTTIPAVLPKPMSKKFVNDPVMKSRRHVPLADQSVHHHGNATVVPSSRRNTDDMLGEQRREIRMSTSDVGSVHSNSNSNHSHISNGQSAQGDDEDITGDKYSSYSDEESVTLDTVEADEYQKLNASQQLLKRQYEQRQKNNKGSFGNDVARTSSRRVIIDEANNELDEDVPSLQDTPKSRPTSAKNQFRETRFFAGPQNNAKYVEANSSNDVRRPLVPNRRTTRSSSISVPRAPPPQPSSIRSSPARGYADVVEDQLISIRKRQEGNSVKDLSSQWQQALASAENRQRLANINSGKEKRKKSTVVSKLFKGILGGGKDSSTKLQPKTQKGNRSIAAAGGGGPIEATAVSKKGKTIGKWMQKRKDATGMPKLPENEELSRSYSALRTGTSSMKSGDGGRSISGNRNILYSHSMSGSMNDQGSGILSYGSNESDDDDDGEYYPMKGKLETFDSAIRKDYKKTAKVEFGVVEIDNDTKGRHETQKRHVPLNKEKLAQQLRTMRGESLYDNSEVRRMKANRPSSRGRPKYGRSQVEEASGGIFPYNRSGMEGTKIIQDDANLEDASVTMSFTNQLQEMREWKARSQAEAEASYGGGRRNQNRRNARKAYMV